MTNEILSLLKNLVPVEIQNPETRYAGSADTDVDILFDAIANMFNRHSNLESLPALFDPWLAPHSMLGFLSRVVGLDVSVSGLSETDDFALRQAIADARWHHDQSGTVSSLKFELRKERDVNSSIDLGQLIVMGYLPEYADDGDGKTQSIDFEHVFQFPVEVGTDTFVSKVSLIKTLPTNGKFNLFISAFDTANRQRRICVPVEYSDEEFVSRLVDGGESIGGQTTSGIPLDDKSYLYVFPGENEASLARNGQDSIPLDNAARYKKADKSSHDAVTLLSDSISEISRAILLEHNQTSNHVVASELLGFSTPDQIKKKPLNNSLYVDPLPLVDSAQSGKVAIMLHVSRDSNESCIRLWDFDSGSEPVRQEVVAGAVQVAINGRDVLVLQNSGRMHWYRLQGGKTLATWKLTHHRELVFDLAAGPSAIALLPIRDASRIAILIGCQGGRNRDLISQEASVGDDTVATTPFNVPFGVKWYGRRISKP